jgi:hypothetical protein
MFIAAPFPCQCAVVEPIVWRLTIDGACASGGNIL